MKNKELENIKVDMEDLEERFVTAAIFLLILAGGALVLICILAVKVNIVVDKAGLIPNASAFSGYHEECYQSHLEGKYELREPAIRDCYDACSLYSIIDTSNDTEIAQYCDEEGFCFVARYDVSCFYKCVDNLKPYIYYWNETACDKTILVKDMGK